MKIEHSVVITAHNRKKYLLNAVESVLNSNVERNTFEIIVVKNFMDEIIDTELLKHGVSAIYTEEVSFGKKLSIGVENSNGKIVSFLDDDDLFTPNKLKRVMDIFTNYHDAVFLHNNIIKIDENNSRTENQSEFGKGTVSIYSSESSSKNWGAALSQRADWYVSCISIRTEFAKDITEYLKESSRSLDKVIFLLASSSSKKIAVCDDKLTYYRKHESLTGVKASSKDFRESRYLFTKQSIDTINEIQKKGGIEENIPLVLILNKLQCNLLIYEKGNRMRAIRKALNLHKDVMETKNREIRILSLLLITKFFSPTIAFRIFKFYQVRDI